MAEPSPSCSNVDKENEGATPRKQRKLDEAPQYGIEAIDRALSKVYGEPLVPTLISSPRKKIWDGGYLPLDFVKVFDNPGSEECKVKPHWHYVTYGISDLYGDERVHKFSGRGHDSGYGFELTFRLVIEDDDNANDVDKSPPTWPVKMLNSLAMYVFRTATQLQEYDHIPWQNSIEQLSQHQGCSSLTPPRNDVSGSLIRNLLVVEDPQILNLDSPHGNVQFLQVVGVMREEFLKARSWRTAAIVDKLLEHPQVSFMLLTDLKRTETIFDLEPAFRKVIEDRMKHEGSYLGKVTSHVIWRERDLDEDVGGVSEIDYLLLSPTRYGEVTPTESLNDVRHGRIDRASLMLDAGGGELLYLMVKGRLKHAASFTFMHPGCLGDNFRQTVEFFPWNGRVTSDIKVNERQHLVASNDGTYLQIYCDRRLITEMDESFRHLERITQVPEMLPMTFYFNAEGQHSLIFRVHRVLPCFDIAKFFV